MKRLVCFMAVCAMLMVSGFASAGDCATVRQRVIVQEVVQVHGHYYQPQIVRQQVVQQRVVQQRVVQQRVVQVQNRGFYGGGFQSQSRGFQSRGFQSQSRGFQQNNRGGQVIRNLLPIAGAVGGAVLGGPLGAGLGAAVGGILGGGR